MALGTFRVGDVENRKLQAQHASRILDAEVGTTVNGIKSSVIARSENNELSITGKNGKSRVKPPIFPTDHWHFGVVDENIVINTLTGDLNKVVILRKNQERLTCGSRSFLAQRYSYTGDLNTDVSYDQENRR